jgi:SAM-dependent methyltransferase
VEGDRTDKAVDGNAAAWPTKNHVNLHVPVDDLDEITGRENFMDEQEILSTLRAHVARAQAVGSNGNGSSGLPGQTARIDTEKLEQLTADMWRLKSSVGQLNPRNPGALNRAVQGFKKFLQRSLSWYTRSLNDYHDSVGHAIDYHARAIAALQEQIAHLGGGLPEALEETLRAAQFAVQEQQAPYAQLFRGFSPVLDIGCGRGEFLEVLKKEGITAYGVDSDRLACEAARKKMLQVIHGDVVEYLRRLPDRSLGGIFSSRMLEYLPSHLQVELVTLCAGKLRPGGILVIETTNPDSDTPFGRGSHIDPTHLRALYPEVLKFMLESNGFEDCRICVLAPQEICVATSGARAVPYDGASNGVVPLAAELSLSRAPAYSATARRR